MSFIIGLMFGPQLALGSLTQNIPGYSPNSNNIDFREVVHKTGIPPKLEQLLSNKEEYRTVQAGFLAIETFSFNFGEIMDAITADAKETWSQADMYTSSCRSEANKYQYSHEMLDVNSRIMEQLIHSLNAMSRVCTMPEIPRSQSVIARCEQGKNWTNIEEFTIIEEIIDNKGTDATVPLNPDSCHSHKSRCPGNRNNISGSSH